MKTHYFMVSVLFICGLLLVSLAESCAAVQSKNAPLHAKPSPTTSRNAKISAFTSEKVKVSFAREAGTNYFRVTMQNLGSDPVMINRWEAFYEVRIFDRQGHQLSNQYAYEQTDPWGKLPWPEDWIVLHAQDSFSFRLSAYGSTDVLAIPPQASKADIVYQDANIQQLRAPAPTRSALVKIPVFPVVWPGISLL